MILTASSWATLLSLVLGLWILLFIFRIVLSWYPATLLTRFPFSVVVWVTEFMLQPVRRMIPPIGGVDLSPIFWVALLSLLREILLGQQGLITMMI